MHKADAQDLDPTRAPSVFDIDVLRLARVYAAALLKAAQPEGVIDEVQESFDTLVGNPLQQSEDASDPAALMASGAIPKARKAEVIEEVFRGKAEDLFVNFLLVLNDHNRLHILRPVAAMYRELRDEFHKRVRVLVRSAVPLSDEQRERVKKLAAEYFDLKPVLVEQVDPELLGGVQIQVRDQLVDLSVRSRLENIKQQLITRSSHEIQRRRDRVGSH
jgi:F-type H+-transporting ATPase subunit delta